MTLQSERGKRARVDLEHLRAWRLEKLLSQDELAERSGVAKSTIVQLENRQHRANLGTVGKLAKGLGISRQELVYEAPPAPPAPKEINRVA